MNKLEKKRMFKIARQDYTSNFNIRFLFLFLLAIILTPATLYIINFVHGNFVDNIKDLILMTMMCGLPLVGYIYHSDENPDMNGFYIELKTIRKVIELDKKYKEGNRHGFKYI